VTEYEVPAVRTPVRLFDLGKAFRNAGLSIAAAELAIAHSALETGWWKECWNWNLGNAKAGPYALHCYRECGEELPATAFQREDVRVRIVKEYERNGRPFASVVFSPNHPQTRFKAFASLEEAVEDHLEMVCKVFPKSWAALKLGNAKGYAAALAAEGYYTADPAQYSNTLVDVLKMVQRRSVWWAFQAEPGESVGDRVARCCEKLLETGPVAEDKRPEVYRSFINCEQTPAGTFFSKPLYDLSGVKTSCGLFVRAVYHWCGRATKPAVISGPLTAYVQADFSSAAWTKADAGAKPNPGDVFFTPKYGGHVGIFLEEVTPGQWRTAEGGGGAGTLCQLTSRRLETVQGWWKCTGLGLPASPPHEQKPRPADEHAAPLNDNAETTKAAPLPDAAQSESPASHAEPASSKEEHSDQSPPHKQQSGTKPLTVAGLVALLLSLILILLVEHCR
jgi:hypothetical protein